MAVSVGQFQHVRAMLTQHVGGVLPHREDVLTKHVGRCDVYVLHSDLLAMQHVVCVLSKAWYHFIARGELFECVSSVIESTVNLVVYHNDEITQNTHEGVSFACENPFSFIVPCTMTFIELQNGLYQSMENDILRGFDIILIVDEVSMQNMFNIHWQTQVRQPKIELYVEFENVEADEIQNDQTMIDLNDSEEDFEATYETSDENEDGDVGGEAAVENVVVPPTVSQPMDVSPFMRNLDLDAMHASEFPKYANIGVVDPEEGEFMIGMEYSSRKSAVAVIRSYTISRGVDYNVYETNPQTFYAKCKTYWVWVQLAYLSQLDTKKDCWEIYKYNGRPTYAIGTILQDHFKLDLGTVAEAIKLLVETDPFIKVKAIIAEVQSRFNYTIGYGKAWLAK
ncbi:hypothetical protein Ahy_B03g067516 [Arachis hypogaea]|uniref:Transposase MuDR plant domain-containing protein n=1 Tax=Arachis hypogaea TaxID=3818 RepID=A0A445A745_ARAHY|nr:hypothetical protein Ahy_B03g067516 [Arachis hypogaea]